MPAISSFYGIVIRMFYNDHAPPHFHAYYGDQEAQIAIKTGGVLRGGLPQRALKLVEAWRLLRQDELLENWARAEARPRQPMEAIKGLDVMP